MKLNRALSPIGTAYPIDAEESVTVMNQAHLQCRSFAPSKRFPNNEFPLRATNIDALNKQTDNSVGRLS